MTINQNQPHISTLIFKSLKPFLQIDIELTPINQTAIDHLSISHIDNTLTFRHILTNTFYQITLTEIPPTSKCRF